LVQFLEAVAELVIGNQAAGVVAFFFIFFRVVLEQELLVILQSGRLLWEGGRLRAGRREIETGGWRLVLLVGLCQSGLFVGFGLGEDGVLFCFGLGQGLLIHLLIGLQLLIQAEIPQSLFQFLIFFQQAVEAEVLVVLGEFFLCRIRFRMLSQGGFQFRKQFRLRCFSRMALKRLCLVRLWTGVGPWLEGCGSRGLGRGHGLAGYRLGRWCCRRGRQGGGRSAGLCPGRRGRSVSGRRLGGRVRSRSRALGGFAGSGTQVFEGIEHFQAGTAADFSLGRVQMCLGDSKGGVAMGTAREQGGTPDAVLKIGGDGPAGPNPSRLLWPWP